MAPLSPKSKSVNTQQVWRPKTAATESPGSPQIGAKEAPALAMAAQLAAEFSQAQVSPKADMSPKTRAKDVINSEIQSMLQVNSVVQLEDFDVRVRQHLHAIYGSGGKLHVVNALQMVHQATSQKSRDKVNKWPAYLGALLKKFAADTPAPAPALFPQDPQMMLWLATCNAYYGQQCQQDAHKDAVPVDLASALGIERKKLSASAPAFVPASMRAAQPKGPSKVGEQSAPGSDESTRSSGSASESENEACTPVSA